MSNDLIEQYLDREPREKKMAELIKRYTQLCEREKKEEEKQRNG